MSANNRPMYSGGEQSFPKWKKDTIRYLYAEGYAEVFQDGREPIAPLQPATTKEQNDYNEKISKREAQVQAVVAKIKLGVSREIQKHINKVSRPEQEMKKEHIEFVFGSVEKTFSVNSTDNIKNIRAAATLVK